MKETELMSSYSPTIDVIYIARGIDWGISAVKNFFESYQKNAAGYEHNLIVAAKAWEDKPQEYEELKKMCKLNNAQLVDLPDDGFDFGAYLRVAQKSNSEYLFCLSTSCNITTENWLKKLVDIAQNDNQYKLIGTQGSWETYPNVTLYLKTELMEKHTNRDLMYTVDKCFLYLKNMKRLIRYKILKQKYPNYFIRTCGFLIEKSLFLEFMSKNKILKNKLDAYELENGKNSLSNFILKKGFQICVIDKLGEKFDKEKFNVSNTYRSELHNCMIKDNKNIFYENSNEEYREALRKFCWEGHNIEQ